MPLPPLHMATPAAVTHLSLPHTQGSYTLTSGSLLDESLCEQLDKNSKFRGRPRDVGSILVAQPFTGCFQVVLASGYDPGAGRYAPKAWGGKLQDAFRQLTYDEIASRAAHA